MADAVLTMSADFAVRCRGCQFTWNTPTMAEGLRVLGACPRCKGELEFAQSAPAPASEAPRVVRDAAPHLVLGIPRL
jgi:uncharacterized paraquat-inducible protein A